MIGRAVGLEAVDAHVGGGVKVPARLGPEGIDVALLPQLDEIAKHVRPD